MRNVVALDPLGRRGQAERLLELFQRGVGAPAVGQPAHALHVQRLLGVLGRHLGQPALVAALRAADFDHPAALLRQPAGQQLGLVDRLRDQHQTRNLHRALVVLAQERGERLLERLVAHAGQREVIAARHLLAADEQHLHDGLIAVHGDPEGVDLRLRGVGGQLLLGDPLHG